MGLEVFGVPTPGGEDKADAEVTAQESGTEPGEPETSRENPDRSKSRFRMLLQGSIVFAVMFLALWWLLSRGAEESE